MKSVSSEVRSGGVASRKLTVSVGKRVVVEKGAPGWPKMVKNRSPIEKKNMASKERQSKTVEPMVECKPLLTIEDDKNPKDKKIVSLPDAPVVLAQQSTVITISPTPTATGIVQTKKKNGPVTGNILMKTQWAPKMNLVKQCLKCQTLFMGTSHECS